MFALVLLALFVVIAIMSLLGRTADSRDPRPRLPLQAPGDQPEMRWNEPVTHAALPPYRRMPLHRA